MADAIPASIPRVALVTGAARRLGAAIAIGLAEAGFAVAVHARDSLAQAEATAAAVRARGVASCVLRADLAREKEVAALLGAAASALGPVGVLVNNASTFERDEWADVTRTSWDAHMEANLRAPFRLMQDFARALPAEAEGVIVNMLDQRVWSPTPHFISYTLSKAGLWTLTQTMALALAPRIRVVGVGPGPALANVRQTAEHFRRQAEATPLGRPTSPEEVARAVLAVLALPSYTGQMLALDGGQHLQWSPETPGPFGE
ncbi:MAG: SDR family oxidoreductase [Rhodospirillales bacterium]|nr:SDR family oxidoreductase [Rhodospirillales bacterium]